MISYHQYIETAVECALEAGKQIMQVYRGDPGTSAKGDGSPLTLADTLSHEVIREGLIKTGLPVLSEEGSSVSYQDRVSWNLFWMVDPLDGTKEFLNKNGEFTVNIALILNKKPVGGVVYYPVGETLYWALHGEGAFLMKGVSPEYDPGQISLEKLRDQCVKLPVAIDKETYTVVASRSHMNEETANYLKKLGQKHGTLNLVSAGSSLKICMVAEGSADEYPRLGPTMEWDTAAAHAIATAAGKAVVAYGTNTELHYNKPDLLNPSFLVS
jgi:3'(2'), 5'-bisphosphate nucleotidase